MQFADGKNDLALHEGGLAYTLRMAVPVEMHHAGGPELQRDVVAIIEHVLSDRPGTGGSQLSARGEATVGDNKAGQYGNRCSVTIYERCCTSAFHCVSSGAILGCSDLVRCGPP